MRQLPAILLGLMFLERITYSIRCSGSLSRLEISPTVISRQIEMSDTVVGPRKMGNARHALQRTPHNAAPHLWQPFTIHADVQVRDQQKNAVFRRAMRSD
jgi:hypothetical protein